MNTTRGMKRIRIVLAIITMPMIVLGAFCTYSGFVQIKDNISSLTQPGGPKIFELYEDGGDRVLSPEDARETILYALKLNRRLRDFGILLIGLSAGLWVLYWIIAGFSSERQPNQSLE